MQLIMQLIIKQKRKIKRTFIKTRNPFLKSALSAISKKIKKQRAIGMLISKRKFRVPSFQMTRKTGKI